MVSDQLLLWNALRVIQSLAVKDGSESRLARAYMTLERDYLEKYSRGRYPSRKRNRTKADIDAENLPEEEDG